MYDEEIQEVIDDQDYLEHHGILGQKWGVRRYQNRDGSLTAEGRKHRGLKGDGPGDKIRKARRTVGNVVKKGRAKAAEKKAQLDEKRRIAAEKDKADAIAKGDAKRIMKYVPKMTDQELAQVKSRAANIAGLKNMAPKEKSTMEKINEWAKTAASISESMSKVDKAMKSLQGITSEGDDKGGKGKKENTKAEVVDGTYKKVGGSYADRMNKLIEDSIRNWDVDTNTAEFNSKAAKARSKSIADRVDRMFENIDESEHWKRIIGEK